MRTAGWRHRGQEAQVRVHAARAAGASASAITTTPAVVPSPMSRSERVVVEHGVHRERPVGDAGQREEHRDHDDVVEDRRERGGEEAASRVEHRGRERDDAVEEHLRHEQPQEVGGELLLFGEVRALAR